MVIFCRDPDLRQQVIYCIIMRFSEKEAMDFITKKGYTISSRTYRYIKKDVIQSRYKRVEEIFDTGLIDQHLQCLDTIQLAQKEMWKKYEECKDAYKSVEILTQIVNTLPFTSQYYDGMRKVLNIRNKISALQQKEFQHNNNINRL
ncbi:MAG: hypothetical protein MRJ93_11595 [Nitrososphaeraceae archaeon]|nr:hypothetical protein [Nitrososphaeraceae archaeon]